MIASKAIQFIKQEHSEVYCFYEKGVLHCDFKGKKFFFTLKLNSRETLDRKIKDIKSL